MSDLPCSHESYVVAEDTARVEGVLLHVRAHRGRVPQQAGRERELGVVHDVATSSETGDLIHGMAVCAGAGGLELGLSLALGGRYRCVYEYPPCGWCGQTPECAKDCMGIGLALSDPSVHIAGEPAL